ncbi:hypothetical protein CGSMWGv1500E_05833 [Gardnerella vaginalis 1500E]|uniref:Uncharacterized protein n=2 Tax=Gardnerella TaxID=2701 RepID=I4LXP3_GARVA|nr:hypothetical protein CGSMWGv1500E_05833 [Gardnerella vaginalis 1500E]EIK86562.1 hypothetical protein CGSMWGv00703Dmash_01600 [Gardnerella greenwoodii 00703Dmash]EIK88018.1 hypothetical protein CGSMWGv6119V5_00702 [Gardnerella vaginalis 6119V5]
MSLAKTCATHEYFALLSDSVDADGVGTQSVQLTGGL